MKRPSLNHTYRLVWSHALGALIAVAESSRSRGKHGGRALAPVLIAGSLALPGLACAAPTGGTVVSGAAAIGQAGAVTNIVQSTQKAAINWQHFSIGAGETVNFQQPNAAAVVLNRVVGNERSVIDGALNANGQVFLVNSAGVLFGKGSQVNVGGLVASTRDIRNADFEAGNYVFSGTGTGRVINQGSITAADGGYVALLGQQAINEGVIVARLGTVSLNAGNRISLDFDGDSLLSVSIEQGVLDALVENKLAIHADGGKVFLTARAADELLGSRVNTSGIVQARTLGDLKGEIVAYAYGGKADIDGTLDASAPNGGNGGFIETSGEQVAIAGSAIITTKAASGKTGSWLIDPTDFTIGLGNTPQTASGIGVDTLSAQLANTAVSIETSAGGTGKGDINVDAGLGAGNANTATVNGLPNSLTLTAAGDINVNAPIYWNASTLTLNAGRNIFVNAQLTGVGTAGLVASYGSGTNTDGTPMGLYAAQWSNSFFSGITLTGTGGVTLNGTPYTVIIDAAGLATVNSNLSGNYVLGRTVSVSAGAAAIGSEATPFMGNFNGLGNYVGGTLAGTGLFDVIGVGATVSNLGVNTSVSQPVSGTITTGAVGALANVNQGSIFNSLVMSGGTINYTTATLDPSISAFYAGSLVGINYGLIAKGYSFYNTVNAIDVAGGLVGLNAAGGVIQDSGAYATLSSSADATDVGYLGGLAGVNAGTIRTSFAAMSYKINDANATTGGVVGWNQAGGVVDQSYATTTSTMTGTNTKVAGFAWTNDGTITNAYTTLLNAGLDDSYSFPNRWSSGFVNSNHGTIDGAYTVAHATTASTAATSLCGFACSNTGTVSNAYWSASTDEGAVTPADNTTARNLTTQEAAAFSNYAGFDPTVWSASLSGYPVLGNIPVYYIAPLANQTETPVYGQATSDSASLGGSFRDIQGGGGRSSLNDGRTFYDPGTYTVHTQFTVDTGGSGYVDAGVHAASSILSSNVYKKIAGTVRVNPRMLQISTDMVADKTYDGTIAASVDADASHGGLEGLVGDQTLNVDWSQLTGLAFSDANAGDGKTVTLVYTSPGVLLSDGTNGGKAGNYTLPTTAATKTNRLSSNACGGSYCFWNPATQAYDLAERMPGTGTSSTIDIWYWNTSTDKFDIFNKQTSGGTTNYYNPNTGTYELTANYTGPAKYFQASTTADILPKTLTADFTGETKTYDGTAAAGVSGGTLNGVVGSDVVTLDTGALSAAFTNANAGTDKQVNIDGLTLTGAAAGNYTIGRQTTTAAINPRVLQLSGNKAEDGNTTVSASNLAAGNAVAGDEVRLGGSVQIAGAAAGTQAITDTSALTVGNPNYTAVGAVGSVVVGVQNLVLDHVASGSATISTAGKATTVNQTSDKAIIDWYRFSLAADETLKFLQPSASAIVLNRVTGNERSVIAGTLQANGRVFLLNSAGVLFAAGSHVDVGALVASSLALSDDEFLADNYVFRAVGGTGNVVNAGDIVIVDGGFVALASNNGISNTGNLSARDGKAVLAAAASVTLDLNAADNGLAGYTVASPAGATTQSGILRADEQIELAGESVTRGGQMQTDKLSLSLPTVTIAGGGNVTPTEVANNLALHDFSVNALSGDLTVDGAVNWSSNSMLELSARDDIHINNAIKATGNSAGLAMNYGGDYHIRTRASYAGTELDAEGKPVAKQDTSGGVYGSVTLSGTNATLRINGNDYTLIHSMDQLDALDPGDSQSGMYLNPNTGDYDTPIVAKAGSIASSTYILSGTNYFNSDTGAFDIPQTKVIDGATKYYNPVSKSWDLDTAYILNNTNGYLAYNPATDKYEIPSYDAASAKYWDPLTQTYALTSRYTNSMTYDPATNQYVASTDTNPANTATYRKYYDRTTGGYTSSTLISYATSYYNPLTGLYDAAAPYAATGYYALAGDLDASGKTYLTSPLEALSGTLAGLGHSIDGLTIDTTVASLSGVGLIAVTNAGSVIRDLGLTNVDIQAIAGAALIGSATGTAVSGTWVTGELSFTTGGSNGALAGRAFDGSTFAHTFAEITATNLGGGLIGRIEAGVNASSIAGTPSSLRNSHVTGTLINASGGLIGSAYGVGIADAYFIGTNALQGKKIAQDENGNILNADIVTSSGGPTGAAGGLVGTLAVSNGPNGVYNSFAIANIASTANYPVVGGLVGQTQQSFAFTMDNSYWKGDIHAFGLTRTNSTTTGIQIGGLIGLASVWSASGFPAPTTTITRSWANGSIEVDGTAAGLVDSVGGLVGFMDHQRSGAAASVPNFISDSWADVDINAPSVLAVGGLVGTSMVLNITNSHASGDIVGGDGNVGGLIGSNRVFQYNDSSQGRSVVPTSLIEGSYFNGTISGSNRVGALAGNGDRVIVNNSYWSDNITAAPMGYGLAQADQWTGGNQALSQETFANGDVRYYIDGTIEQVLADRAAAGQGGSGSSNPGTGSGGNTPPSDPGSGGGTTPSDPSTGSGGNTPPSNPGTGSGTDVVVTPPAQPGAAPDTSTAQRAAATGAAQAAQLAQLPVPPAIGTGQSAPPASLLDASIVFADSTTFSANIQRIEVDGVFYQIETPANDNDEDKNKARASGASQ